MKKIVFLLMLLFLPLSVRAASFSTSITGNSTFEGSTSLKVAVGSIEGFNGDCNGFCGLDAKLSYDKEKIQITVSGLNGFTALAGGKLSAYSVTGVTAKTEIATITVKNIGLEPEESTTISLSDVKGSDGNSNYGGKGSSITLKVKENNTTTTTKKVTTKTTTKKSSTTTTTTTTAKSINSEDNTTTTSTTTTTIIKKADDKKEDNKLFYLAIFGSMFVICAVSIVYIIIKKRRG